MRLLCGAQLSAFWSPMLRICLAGLVLVLPVQPLAAVVFASVGNQAFPQQLPTQQAPQSPVFLHQTTPIEFGLPPIQKFLPAEYQAHRQNWAFAQTADGLIYVGNSSGVLEYDGLRWRLIEMPKKVVVRALAVDPTSGRVYVGAKGDVGYLAPDPHGVMQYHSLLAEIPAEHRAFSHVFHCHINARGVFFTSMERLFRFGPDGVRSWPAQKQFVQSISIDNRFYLRDEGIGLLEQSADTLQLAPAGELFASHRITTMMQWPGTKDLLIVSSKLGFMRYDGQTFQRWPTEVDAELPDKLVSSLWALADGRIAVGMLQGGMYILDSNGRKVGQLNSQTGLPENTIKKLRQDREQGLWVGTENGLARVQLGGAFSRFDTTHGLDGITYAMQRYQGQLYVGTTQGLFRLIPGPLPKFEAVPGVSGVVWALKVYQDQLLIANFAGVYRLSAAGMELLYKLDGPHELLLLPGPKPQLLVAEFAGVSRLVLEGQQWRLAGKIDGITESVRGMVVDDAGVLWLKGRNQKWLLRLTQTGPDWQPSQIEIQRFDLGKQFSNFGSDWLVNVEGQARIIYQNSLYQLDVATGQLQADPRFQGLFAAEEYHIVAVGNISEGLVVLARHQSSQHLLIGKAIRQADGNFLWQLQDDSGFSDVDSWHREPDGRIWLGGTELYQWDPKVPPFEAVPFQLLLRNVVAADGQVLNHPTGAVLSLNAQQNKLRFEFAATSYQSKNQYAVWLEGVDKGWTEWSHEAFASYNSLWEGRYLLKVKARNSAGVEAHMTPLQLQIAPPWFRTPLMYISYLLALFLLINRWYRWRTKKLRQQALALETMVEQRTHQLSEAKIVVEHTVEELQHTLTSLKSTQRQLVRSEKMAALGQLVAGVAHEVNTPLGVALTGSSFLRESTEALAGTLSTGQLRKQDLDNFLGSALESSQLIERNLHRAANLISNFKQVSVDRTSGDRRQFELKSFLAEVEQSLVTLWRQRPLQFTVDCPAGISMDSFPGTLSQVITILAQNSLLHAFAPDEAGLMMLSVRVLENEIAGTPAQIELSFADNGKGIPAADLDKVFEPFFTTKRAQGGTGLGLHILFNLVSERLGGTVYVESGYVKSGQARSSMSEGSQLESSPIDSQTPQQGCRFILLLPTVAPSVS
ncbi:hypothetical protein A5320_02885 [Rheinheimera sp. SA_1]|uniref:sensor histidine kinase n=1 Tax=Rheinheimera sp. SA_1 TaxID=1827365 RepID=UPI0007FCC7A6|nr:ATP-binding protein [Rheinheimera sp. SA_1]OBP16370.1 hypothetical protein A5320_02885 [Rheinheimera sp. SA_1]